METENTQNKASDPEKKSADLVESSSFNRERLRTYLKNILLSKRLPALIRNWTFTLSVVILLIVLIKLIFADIKDESYRIQAFRMPQDFVADGYDGTTTAYVLLDRVNDIIGEGNHTRSVTTIEKYNQNFEQSEVKLEVSGIGISPEAISSYFKKVLGIQTNNISGEFVRENTSLKLFLRITGKPTQTIEEPMDSVGRYRAFKKLIQRGAESILKMNNPTLLGLYYGSNGDYEQAFESFRFAIQRNPKMAANIYAWWGENLYHRDNDTTYAMPKIRKALSIDPNNAAAYNIWGNMGGHFKYEEQIEVLKKATELDPNCVACWNDLGATLDYKMENEAEAIKCYEKCYALDSTYTTAINHWAALLFTQGKIDQALEKVEQLSYQKFNFNSLLYLYISIAQNNKPQALAAYKNMIKEYAIGSMINRLNNGAFRQEQRGNYGIALKLVRFALDQDSTTSAAALPFSTLAELEALTGNREGFYGHIDKSIKLGLFKLIDKQELKGNEPYKSMSNDKRFQEILKQNNIVIF